MIVYSWYVQLDIHILYELQLHLAFILSFLIIFCGTF